MTILIINGPNLNLLGIREPSVYGHQSMQEYLNVLQKDFDPLQLRYFQSNSEGEIIDKLQQPGEAEGILLNAGGYTHTSVAIADALASVSIPVIEIHISNPAAREPYRHISLLARFVKGSISGFGMESYRLGILSLSHIIYEK